MAQRQNETISIQILNMVAQSLEAGAPIDIVKQEFPKVFVVAHPGEKGHPIETENIAEALGTNLACGPVEQAILEMGERAGQMPFACREAASSIAHRLDMRNQLIGRLLYPSFLLSAASMILQIPILFRGALSDYLVQALPIPLVIVSLLGFIKWIEPNLDRASVARKRARQLLYGLPLTRHLMLAGVRYRFLFALRKGLQSGLGFPQAVDLALRAGGFADMPSLLRDASRLAESGASLKEVLASTSIFPAPMLGAAAIGEQTGTLEKTLDRLQKDALDARTRVMTRFVWAVSILVFGAVIVLVGMTLIQGVQNYFDQINQVLGSSMRDYKVYWLL